MKKISGTRSSIICVILLILTMTIVVCWSQLGALFMAGEYNNEDNMVETIMAKSATPGVAIVLSNHGEIEYKTYGYADVNNKKMVDEESLFELGSTTKAFTALGIILLANEGSLSYSDLISDYIPWFEATYNGEKANITIHQLLAHTSGIPSWSIKLIPEGTTEDLLETTIHNISDIKLDTSPGTEYHYATVNYDVLAMIIEQISGESYQQFVTENILIPLNMTDSYFSTGQENKSDKLTKGYRVFFGKHLEYDAPRYYGNIAAGYLVSNLKDLEHWINAQMGIGDIPEHLMTAIQQSHEVDLQTAGYEATDQYYSFGWSINPNNKVVAHSGSNPNYSSQVIIDFEQKQAVFVLANLNSSAPTLIADNLYATMNGKNMNKYNYNDIYILIDLVFSFLVVLTAINLSVRIIQLVRGIELDINNKKTRTRKVMGCRVALIIRIVFLVLLITWPYLINNNYELVKVWMSYSILIWTGIAAINCILVIIIITKKIRIIRRSL